MTEKKETVHLFKGALDLKSLHRWMGRRHMGNHGQAMHSLLREGMGHLTPSVHRVWTPERKSRGVIIGYAPADAETLARELQACADPLQHQIIVPGSLESKEMPTDWEEGRELGFEVRLRPTVRLEKDITRVHPEMLPGYRDGRLWTGGECDVRTWESVRRDSRGESPPEPEEVYPQWLEQRMRQQGGCAPDPDQMILADCQRNRFSCKGDRPGSLAHDVVIRGILQVQDPEKFRLLLSKGIGRYRTYGYGMMLIRPALRAPNPR